MEHLAYIPASYSEDDPLDVKGMTKLVQGLHTGWWMEPPDQQRQAIANAFRAALTSPQQNLKWNSVVYQDLAPFPANYANPDGMENHIRGKKAAWDQMGQTTLDMAMGRTDMPDMQTYAPHMVEKYQPGIWKNIRNAGNLGPYVEELRRAALDDIAQGGDGKLFRQRVLAMNIPGIGPKITSFAWLLLNPEGSKLATIDVHMMRALNQDQDTPLHLGHYHDLEDMLDKNKTSQGYDDVPTGAYQWAVWDHQRTPGYHQDHTPLRPLNPTPWHTVDWAPQLPPQRSQQPADPNQLQLQTKWDERPLWTEPIWR